ncbi:snurportin-1 [Topomyia yanbarensis]|uniref:snurportin-1 n=1 Tax=Topomyia yanbarensis TaxID=2498891 RepID=UPI00273CB61B|nr:snurportin-1 [Topomyia yanbarensis]
MTDSDDSTSRFTDLYKNNSRKEHHQSERRRTLLEEQKRLRQTEIDSSRRGLLELIETEAADSECSFGQQQRHKPRVWFSKLYRDKVQLSEWMYERPDDLENWFMVPCPVGTRCLLVIRRGLAVAYDKNGRSMTRFATRLGKKHRVTVLDCFLTKDRIFYAIDLLVYNEMDLVQCDCRFRFLWLRSKLEEDAVPDQICNSKESGWRLEVLPLYDFSKPNQVADCLSLFPAFNEKGTRLDGLLFYHKDSNYIYGRTPLVTWLFPFMVPDLLGESWRPTMNHRYFQQIPADYSQLGYRAYMDEFDAKLARKRSRRNHAQQTGGDMVQDTDESTCTEDLTAWEQMEAVTTINESYEDEDWQRKELDEIRRLEMEG